MIKTWLRAEWDRALGGVLIAAGVVVLIAGYRGVATSELVLDQLTYLASGGIFGLLLVGAGTGLLTNANLHDEWRKLDRIEALLSGAQLADDELILDSSEEHLALLAPEPESEIRHDTGGTEAPGGNGGSGERGFSVSAAHPTEHAAVAVTTLSQLRAEHAAVGIGPCVLRLDWAGDRLPRNLGLSTFIWFAGAGLALVGWRHAATAQTSGTGFTGLAVALFGLLVALAARTAYPLWLRDRILQRIEAVSQAIPRRLRDSSRNVAGSRSAADSPDTVLIADDGNRYHRPGCPSLRFARTRKVSRSEAQTSRRACGICQAT